MEEMPLEMGQDGDSREQDRPLKGLLEDELLLWEWMEALRPSLAPGF